MLYLLINYKIHLHIRHAQNILIVPQIFSIGLEFNATNLTDVFFSFKRNSHKIRVIFRIKFTFLPSKWKFRERLAPKHPCMPNGTHTTRLFLTLFSPSTSNFGEKTTWWSWKWENSFLFLLFLLLFFFSMNKKISFNSVLKESFACYEVYGFYTLASSNIASKWRSLRIFWWSEEKISQFPLNLSV